MCDIDFKKLQKLDPKSIKTLTKNWTDKKTGEKKSMSQRYITARTVMNILDSVVGPQNWRAEYRASNLTPAVIVMQCTLYLKIDGEWIGKSDIGTQSDIEPEKGAASDAFKRAAVHWGIGRELYNEGIADLNDDDEIARDLDAIFGKENRLEPKRKETGKKAESVPQSAPLDTAYGPQGSDYGPDDPTIEIEDEHDPDYETPPAAQDEIGAFTAPQRKQFYLSIQNMIDKGSFSEDDFCSAFGMETHDDHVLFKMAIDTGAQNIGQALTWVRKTLDANMRAKA